MDNSRFISIKRGLLWAGITPVVIFIPSLIVGVFGLALGFYPASTPFGGILSLFASIVTLFPWEFSTLILQPCDGLPPQCNTEEALFQLTFLSLALSVVFYACAGFVLGLLRQCVTVSTTKGNAIEFDITHKKIVLALCIVLGALTLLLILGNILNLQKVS